MSVSEPANGRCPVCGAQIPLDEKAVCPRCALVEALASSPGDHDTEFLSLHDIPPPGQKVSYIGDYELLEVIARGGMGVVYKARQCSLNRIVALKMLLGGVHAGDAFKRRFRQEAETVAKLQHPNIVPIYEVGEHEGQPYFSMEFVAGQTLAEKVREHPLPAKDAAEYVQTVAQAVQYAHGQGVLHRDLKPSNILVGPDNRPRVTDFGLARLVDADSSLTLSGQALGTPGYVPPEQASSKQGEIGPQSDVYSLGAFLYHLLTGRPPFAAGSVAETLDQVLHTDPVAPRSLNLAVPQDLETICLHCLEKEPPRRYGSALDLATELGRFLAGEPILASPPSAAGRAWKWAQRRPVVAGLSFGLALALLLGLAGVTWQWRRAELAKGHVTEMLAKAVLLQATDAFEVGMQGDALLQLQRFLMETPDHSAARSFLHTRLESESFLTPHHVPLEHSGEAASVASDYSRDRVITSGQGGTKVFQASSGKLLFHVEKEHQVAGAWAGATDDVLLVGGPGKFARIWSLSHPDLPRLVWQATNCVALAISSDHSHFAVSLDSGLCWLGDLRNNPDARPLTLPAGSAAALAINNLGSTIAALTGDDLLFVWMSTTGRWLPIQGWPRKCLKPIITPDGQLILAPAGQKLFAFRSLDGSQTFDMDVGSVIGEVAISPDGTKVALATRGGDLLTIDLRKAQEVKKANYPGSVVAMGFSRSGQHLVTTSGDGRVSLFLTAPLRVVASAEHPQFVWSAEFDDQRAILITAGSDGLARRFRLVGRATDPLVTQFQGVTRVVPQSAQRRLIVLTQSGEVWSVQYNRGRISRNVHAAVNGATTMAVVGDPKLPAWVADSRGDIFGIPISTSGPAKQVLHLPEPARHIAVSQNGRRLAAAGRELLSLAELSDRGAKILTNISLFGTTALQFSHGGDRLVAGFNHGWLVSLSATSGQVEWINDRHSFDTTGIAFSSDDTRLATTSFDKTTRVWDPSTGVELLAPLRTSTEGTSITFDRPGQRLSVGTQEGLVFVWNARTGRELCQFGTGSSIPAVDLSSDGSALISADNTGHLSLWNVSPPLLLGRWSISPRDDLSPIRSRCAWLDEGRLAAGWTLPGTVRFVELSLPPTTPLLIALCEWLSGLSCDAAGAVTALGETARHERLTLLQAAIDRGELPPNLTRLLPPQ